jgi:hypothetical protein
MTKAPDPKAKIARLVLVAKPGQEKVIQAFKEVCRKDGLEVSKELHTLVQSWLRAHNYPPGNPQRDIRDYDKPPSRETAKTAPKVLCPINCVIGIEKYGYDSCRERRRYVCRFDS